MGKQSFNKIMYAHLKPTTSILTISLDVKWIYSDKYSGKSFKNANAMFETLITSLGWVLLFKILNKYNLSIMFSIMLWFYSLRAKLISYCK